MQSTARPLLLLAGLVLTLCLASGLVPVPSGAPGASPTASAATSDRVPVPNGGFERGRVGWVGMPAARARLWVSDRGHNSGHSVRLVARRKGWVAIGTRHRVADRAPVGTAYVWSAWLRTSRTGQRIRLEVREFSNGRLVQTRRTGTRLRSGRWTRIQVRIPRTRSGSRFAVRVVSLRQWRSDRLLIDDVAARRVRPKPAPPPAAGTLSSGCGYSARGLPSCGAYLGSAYGSNTEPSAMESQMGRRLGVRRTYFTGAQVDSGVRTAAADLAAGRLPWISFKLPHTWADMASGRGDAWARDLAGRLARLPGPVWVAFHHEPEGDGDIQAWRRMQERLAPLVRSTAPNVGFTVIMTGWHQFYGDDRYSLDAIWPRGVKVDVAGFDVYNQYGVVKNGVMNTRATNLPVSYFDPISAWAARHDVAWGIAETGFTHKAARVYPHWIDNTYEALQARGGVAFTYFNTTLNSIAPWELSTTPKVAAYREGAVGSPLLPPH